METNTVLVTPSPTSRQLFSPSQAPETSPAAQHAAIQQQIYKKKEQIEAAFAAAAATAAQELNLLEAALEAAARASSMNPVPSAATQLITAAQGTVQLA